MELANIPSNKAGDVESGIPTPTRPNNSITWSSVNFKVGGLQILDNCWGDVPSGKVCAIMGPSGSGKSSLLNVLAGRSASSGNIKVSGKICVAGTEINPVKFRQNIAYVMQDDALMATATPREALEFSAALRLSSDTKPDEITKLVTALLDELGLADCADTMIGGPLIKGISGGQRKRTSVGVEIITNPSLLFLDEPTSGLDSYSAFNCITLLKKVAQRNTAVLCTIHQPSSEVFFLFDLVIFLKSGKIFFQGPASQAADHFSQHGFECPNNYNPSDFIMYVCQKETNDSLEKCGLFMPQPKDWVQGAITDSDDNTASAAAKGGTALTSVTPVVTGSGQMYNKVASQEDLEMILDIPVKASFFRQLWWLLCREVVNTRRDKAALIGRYGVTIFLNLLFGLIFYNAGGKDDANPSNFNSHFGAIAMIVIASMFGSAQPVMLQFPFERPMFMREFSTGTYGALAYFLSKVALELPMTFVQSLCQFVLVYFLVNMQGNFIYLVLAAWALGCASSSVAMSLGCLVPDVKSVTELAPLLFVPQLLFAGFFVRTSQIPAFLRWAQYLCGIKYGMNLIILIEFNPKLPSCSGMANESCRALAATNNVVPSDWWVYILLLCALFLGFRVLGSIVLVQKSKKFY